MTLGSERRKPMSRLAVLLATLGAGGPFPPLAAGSGRFYAGSMFVEGTLRWQVTEDCPWDLLMALCLRDLGGLTDLGDQLPPVIPAVQRAEGGGARRRSLVHHSVQTDADELRVQWSNWWHRTLIRESRPIVSMLRPPHFTVFDRELELQDLVEEYYEDALAWTSDRRDEYITFSTSARARQAMDIVDVVRDREHVLRRQAGSFRLDMYVMPLAEKGAWIVAPQTIVVSQSLRNDAAAFRQWFTPIVHVLV